MSSLSRVSASSSYHGHRPSVTDQILTLLRAQPRKGSPQIKQIALLLNQIDILKICNCRLNEREVDALGYALQEDSVPITNFEDIILENCGIENPHEILRGFKLRSVNYLSLSHNNIAEVAWVINRQVGAFSDGSYEEGLNIGILDLSHNEIDDEEVVQLTGYVNDLCSAGCREIYLWGNPIDPDRYKKYDGILTVVEEED